MDSGGSRSENRSRYRSGTPTSLDGSTDERGRATIQLVLFAAGVVLFVAGLLVVAGGSPFAPTTSGTANATDTPTGTPTPAATATATPAATDSSTDSPTDSSTSTSSPTATDDETETSSPTTTATASPTPSSNTTTNGSVDARILAFSVQGGTYQPGDLVNGSVTVRNTGTKNHTFFVGFSVIGPDGDYYYNEDTNATGKQVQLEPGERKTVAVQWRVESDAPDGEYDAVTIVWKEHERQNLETQLDRVRIDDVFRVERESTNTTETDDG